MKDSLNLILHFDGSCNPNPGGTPKYGWHLDTTNGASIAEGFAALHGLPVEQRTCNIAEWAGLRAGLIWVAGIRFAAIDTLTILGDSQLVVNQFTGDWKCKKVWLAAMRAECRDILSQIDAGHVEARWVAREENERADALSTKAAG